MIPADGLYEWVNLGARKLPDGITPADGQPVAFAGWWECWERDGQVLESGTIRVTPANALVASIHDRLPVPRQQFVLEGVIEPLAPALPQKHKQLFTGGGAVCDLLFGRIQGHGRGP